eukprot:9476587-Pyramimonas_sp.AAC.1
MGRRGTGGPRGEGKGAAESASAAQPTLADRGEGPALPRRAGAGRAALPGPELPSLPGAPQP